MAEVSIDVPVGKMTDDIKEKVEGYGYSFYPESKVYSFDNAYVPNDDNLLDLQDLLRTKKIPYDKSYLSEEDHYTEFYRPDEVIEDYRQDNSFVNENKLAEAMRQLASNGEPIDPEKLLETVNRISPDIPPLEEYSARANIPWKEQFSEDAMEKARVAAENGETGELAAIYVGDARIRFTLEKDKDYDGNFDGDAIGLTYDIEYGVTKEAAEELAGPGLQDEETDFPYESDGSSHIKAFMLKDRNYTFKDIRYRIENDLFKRSKIPMQKILEPQGFWEEKELTKLMELQREDILSGRVSIDEAAQSAINTYGKDKTPRKIVIKNLKKKIMAKFMNDKEIQKTQENTKKAVR